MTVSTDNSDFEIEISGDSLSDTPADDSDCDINKSLWGSF